VAPLTFGEGWHNNHHAPPTSARDIKVAKMNSQLAAEREAA